MTTAELWAIVRWADMAELDADFWRRLWFAAAAYPLGVCLMVRGFVARFGIVPQIVV